MKIVYFSPIMWNDLKQRPQHIAEELARTHEVSYIEPSVSLISSIINRNHYYKKEFKIIGDNLSVYRPSGIWRLPKSLESRAIMQINTRSERRQLHRFMEDADLFWLGSPIFEPLIGNQYRGKKIIYDKMDDYQFLTSNSLLRKVIGINEERLVKRADSIFISSKAFYDKISRINPKVHLINNGVDSDTIMCSEESKISQAIRELKKNNNTVFGYVGTIDHWFDYEIIQTIIDSDPHFHVLIVGRNNIPTKKIVSNQVHYYDPIPKKQVFDVIKHLDYGLYCFKQGDYLDTIDPVKIYEYLSCNKKIIAVSNEEIDKFGDKIIVYKTKSDVRKLLGNLTSFQSPFSTELDLNLFIQTHSWRNRVREIGNIIGADEFQFNNQ
ncbi:hypothetical protein [Paenibacillus sp. GbtcB18]|uniref:hypothetical protein n=1 Tax=Paenibacillus sp. GbtcB18 TaxID=2824763 RepID=UPI001C2F120A|nr:hypothetical protein [Paenibacillus sp. GbtcB18]